jgi:CheY-like chemotaxis protein
MLFWMHAQLSADLQDACLPADETLPSALIIEANSALRAAVAGMLERFCPRVLAPTNGLRAFDLLTAQPPALIVLGTPLPDLDSDAFTRMAHAISHGSVRTLALSEGTLPAAGASSARA